ncbi:hypothetical protein A3A63_03340 [Candidatus Gottesmanbacteria bacterium RIFCSPLOWO2_01_FULL_46_9]|uniref:Antitoxin n=1 Tax=Candidatus Gottesmanbacteria bacterium RIFCSPLOWO2_01_FULL_46_9 TaxID=1798394 RepID=A0A1F6AYF1_9BACT|nr:MAG: hypothetical protein A3A63_03340 [Candidatus Gottesmanbacteria bacterium RIFCSPLOWO2_01_FULL_46_9]
MPANQARANFYQMIEEAGEDMRQFTITHRSGKPVIVMSVDEFESWQETLEIMSDKKLVADIKQAENELKAGKGIPWEKVRTPIKK